MIDRVRLEGVIVQYKLNFVEKQWPKERYKWEAVKCFQDNWDVNADDFAQSYPEDVRSMFLDLFDESKDVFERINAFKMQSEVLLEKYGNGAAQHYQYENAISTYLWLRFPDTYYIYKYSEVKSVAKELKTNYTFKKGAITENVHHFLNLYDELNGELKKDEELKQLLQSQLTETCYPDPELT